MAFPLTSAKDSKLGFIDRPCLTFTAGLEVDLFNVHTEKDRARVRTFCREAWRKFEEDVEKETTVGDQYLILCLFLREGFWEVASSMIPVLQQP